MARAEELDEASPEQHDRARGHADNRRAGMFGETSYVHFVKYYA
jgi:hypothetical protein